MMPLVGIDWADLVFAAGMLALADFAAYTVYRLPKVWRGETRGRCRTGTTLLPR